MKQIRLWFCVLVLLLLSGRLSAVVVSTIEQLDTLAVENGGFSFSIMGDNNGYEAWQYTRPDGGTPDPVALGMARLQPWIENNDEFCLAVGDHAIGTRKYWYRMNETNAFWHNQYYPSLGDNCNGTDYFYGVTGDQAVWGRGWVMFKALNNFFTRSNATEQIVFRQPDTNSPVYSSVSKADPDTLVPYPDQLCDYYAKRKQGNFTFHIISVNMPDPGVLAARSKDFMMNKLYELSATKTDHDIIVVLAQKNNWLKRAQDKGWISRAERDALMTIADLTVCGDDHVYRRQNNFDADYDRTEALWMNSGAPQSTGALWGYLNVHVFDNPPRFVVQYIDVQNQSTRKLHVNAVKKSSTQQAQPDADTKPVMKYVNGPYVSVDWNNFPIEPFANDAAFVSQVVPNFMEPGETATARVTIKNLGTNVWSSATGYSLGSLNALWTATNRVAVSNSVSKWTDHTFSFQITAPSVPGYYDFQWRMVDDAGADAGWFGAITPVVSVNVRSVEQVQHGTVLLAVDFHQNVTDPVPVTPTNFVGWMIGDVASGIAAPTLIISNYYGKYNLTVGSGTSIACLTTPASQKGMNARNRSTGFIPNAGSFTQAALMQERIASLSNPTDPATGNGIGAGLYLRISGLTPNTPYVFQAWGVDSTGTNPNAYLKPGYNYGFDATRETAGYSNLPLLGNYSVSGSPTVISDNNHYSVIGKITSDSTGKIIYKQISNFDKSVMNGFMLSTVPPSNSAPVVTSVPVTNAAQDSAYSYTLTATDVDSDPLVFSGVTEPSWLSFDTNSGVLSGIPTASDIGEYSVALRVSDGSLSVTQSFTIAVAAVVTSGYEAWATTNTVGAAVEDEDNDGFSNFYEYALNGDPNTDLDTGTEPTFMKADNDFEYTHLQRSDDPTLTYTLQISTDLLSGVWTNATFAAQTNGTGGAYDEVTHRIPMGDTKSYIRLKITDQ